MIKNEKQKIDEKKDMVIKKIHESLNEVGKLTRMVRDKYDKADEKTKNRVLASVVGAAALLGGAIGIKAIKNKMKKKEEVK